MTHDQAKVLLLDLAFGELAPDLVQEVSRHANGCAECTDELARIAAVRRAAAMLDDRPPSPASRAELLRAAQRAASSGRDRRWLARPSTRSFAAAAAVAAIVAGVTLKLTRDDLGGAGTGLRSVGENATPRAPEPPIEERPAARPEPAAPASAAARSPASKAPGRRPPAPPSSPSPNAAAPAAPDSATGSARKLSQQPHAASNLAAPPATGAALPSQRSVGGPIVEERRQVQCGDVLVERVALVAPGGRIVKLTERRGEAVAEGWYDAEGRLQVSGRQEQAGTGASGLALPPIAPTLEALGAACGW